MGVFWFVVIALLLLPLALGMRAAEAILGRWEVQLDALEATPVRTTPAGQFVKHVVKLQGGYSAVLFARMMMLTVFGLLAIGLACLAVFQLSVVWGIVYIVLGLIGLGMLRIGATEQPPTVALSTLVILACMLWVALHTTGATHFSVPSFHVDFHTPSINITIS